MSPGGGGYWHWRCQISVATLGVAPQYFEGEGFIKTTRRLQLHYI